MNKFFVDLDAEHQIDGPKIVLRPQHAPDRAKLAKVCPPDQTVLLQGRYVDGSLVIEPAPPTVKAVAGGSEGANPATVEARTNAAADRAKLLGTDAKVLRRIAGELEVPWDNQASPETMVDRILAAQAAKAGQS